MSANAAAMGEQQVAEVLASHGSDRGELIPILQKIQGRLGYLPEAAMRSVATHLRLSESNVYGVASFYAQFRFRPVGRKQVHVCRGTACHVRGASVVLDEMKKHLGISEGETTPDGEYSLETVACIGCCALAPCAVVDNKTEARLTAKKVKGLFAKADKTDEL